MNRMQKNIINKLENLRCLSIKTYLNELQKDNDIIPIYNCDQLIKCMINIINGENIALVSNNPMIDSILFILYEEGNNSEEFDFERGYIYDKIIESNIRFVNSSTPEIITLTMCSGELSVRKLKDKFIPHNMNIASEELMSDDIYSAMVDANIDKIKKLIDNYNMIAIYRQKESLSEEDCERFMGLLLSVDVPERLAKLYVSYCKNKERTKEQEETPIIKNDVYKIKPKKIQPKQVSKRELKQKLSELYHEEENEAYFDFKNSKELFTVVKDLNMPDEKAKEILGGITRCAIKNQAYYDYLVEKVTYLNQTNRYKGRFTSTLNDIEEYRQLYQIVDEEAKGEIKQELLNLYTGLEFIFVESDALGKILEFEMKD